MYEIVNKHNHLLTCSQILRRAPLVAPPRGRKRGRGCDPGAEIGAGSCPADVMAEAALEAVRRALQEFPAAARGECTLTGSSDRARTARREPGHPGTLCMSVRPVATQFCVYPSLAGGRLLSSGSHAWLPSWGAGVVFKTQHSSDGSHGAILKASGVLSPRALPCYTFTSNISDAGGF